VFPSWLYHWVHPYTGERPRIAISFNAMVAPVLARDSNTISSQLAQEKSNHVDSPLVA
jgi:hypothetical protein